MSTYKNLIGKDVNFLSTDPDNSQAEGQIWYNSTSNVFKDLIVGEAWSASAALLNPGYARGGAGASQTDGMIFGGQNPDGYLNTTNEYNGSGFSAGGNLNTAKAGLSGAGTVPAGLAFGGRTSPTAFLNESEEYNGSSWTEGNNLNTARAYMGEAGTQTAAVAVGGFSNPPNTKHAVVEQYNGTSWSETGSDYPGNMYDLQGAGTLTAAVFAGGTPGSPPYAPGLTTEYNGSTFTTAATMGTAAYNAGMFGTQTSAIFAGGVNDSVSPIATSQKYDGTTWTTTPSLASARNALGAFGADATAGLMGGGVPVTDTTQEFTRSINIITGGAWASGGNMGTARYTAGDCGVYNAGLVFGGNPSSAPYTNNSTEEYGGTSWTAGGNLPHASSDVSGAGTQTAALAFGFGDSPTATTATYDGSSWTTVPGTVPGATSQGRGIGTQTAAIHVGFASPGTTSLEYDGSSWTAGGTLNNKRSGQKPGGWGIQTAAVLASGYQTPPATIISNTETYNGTSWTETGHSVVAARKRTSVTTAGPNSNGMLMGGGDNAGTNDSSNTVQLYNGTTWVTQANLATARINPAGFGTSTNAVVAGGGPPVTAATEEFTGETSALNIKTITTS